MDKQELISEVATAALAELDKMQKQYVQVASPQAMLTEVFEGMGGKKPAEETITPASLPFSDVNPLCVIQPQPDFPRLLVSYGKQKVEYLVVNSFKEWLPYHDFYTIWPPQQAASKVVTTTLEQEIEKLQANGIPERPKEEHERRKATNGYTQS